MGRLERGPLDSELNSGNLFPTGPDPVDKGILAFIARDTKRIVSEEQEEIRKTNPSFLTFLDLYFEAYQERQLDSNNSHVNRDSFDQGAMLVNRILREQAEAKKTFIPAFHDPKNAVTKEMEFSDMWALMRNISTTNFATVAQYQILHLSKLSKDRPDDIRDGHIGKAIFQAATFNTYPPSFFVGAAASYFSRRNAWEESQQIARQFKLRPAA